MNVTTHGFWSHQTEVMLLSIIFLFFANFVAVLEFFSVNCSVAPTFTAMKNLSFVNFVDALVTSDLSRVFCYMTSLKIKIPRRFPTFFRVLVRSLTFLEQFNGDWLEFHK